VLAAGEPVVPAGEDEVVEGEGEVSVGEDEAVEGEVSVDEVVGEVELLVVFGLPEQAANATASAEMNKVFLR